MGLRDARPDEAREDKVRRGSKGEREKEKETWRQGEEARQGGRERRAMVLEDRVPQSSEMSCGSEKRGLLAVCTYHVQGRRAVFTITDLATMKGLLS